MRRFLLLWICLAPPLVVTTFAISIISFRHLDLRYVAFVQLLVIPTCQAAVVTWVGGQCGLSRLAWAVRETIRHRLIALFVVLDVGFLCLGVVMRGHPIFGVAGQSSVHPGWAAVKALIAGAALLGAALLWSRDSRKHRVWVLGLAGFVVAVASNAFFPWLDDLPELIHGVGPLVIRWLVVYGGLSTLGLIVLFQVSAKVRERSPLAAFYFDLAGACIFAVVLVFALNIFLRPFLVEPWASIVRVLASIGASAFLIGSSLVFAHRGHDRKQLR